MCGIIGYVGERSAQKVLLAGLGKLEYRGYDSAGAAIFSDGELIERKFKGRLSVLAEYLERNPIEGNLGIGHTRWATHGAPSDANAHPHSSEDHVISLVHNGIIENYQSLKAELLAEGVHFTSETDTEVVAHLIRKYYKNDLLDAVIAATSRLRGAYALCVLSAKEPDKIVAVRRDSPLIIGLGSGENFVASDIPAVLEYTRDVYLMEDMVYAVVTKDSVTLCDSDKNPVHSEVFKVTWDAADAGKGGYEHFMLKEIYEQPAAVRNTLRGRLDDIGESVTLDDFELDQESFADISKIYISACGTAYYAGQIGKYLIEKYARISVETDIASEFRYKNPLVDRHTLFIAVSQSGETADTLASLRLAKKLGARVLSITNVLGSSVARESDKVLYTWAGPEIAVASTKAFTTQVVCMFLLAMKLGELKGTLSAEQHDSLRDALHKLDSQMEETLADVEPIKRAALLTKDLADAFFIGRGLNYYLALEGALKMKEISYIHAEAYQAGELKHGPIALIEEGSVVFASLICTGELLEKSLSNIKEVRARGAKVVAIAMEGTSFGDDADEVLYIPSGCPDAMLLCGAEIVQLLAYYTAILRGCDVDKPRNLAKSVTVE